ncbi:hypothetical protein NTJ56_24695 [Burkholderia contaminans]|uniref:hypothetical protein n=1 Tax=Burkholderia contaminans TaxID=488447 RepID=UPI001CF5BFFB|nr:hypothetical protein [Burkholderia contaminans]MCA7914288.1 hypothetical protein [Burkholderia contaminans]MCA8097989.1 hypothetical protein [Burkholderia contaminans]UUX41613.1 hypothetical protein NTJ56_24695 [Burkholderia contaminans]
MNITILDDSARDGVLMVEVNAAGRARLQAGRAWSIRCARRAIAAPRVTPDLP